MKNPDVDIQNNLMIYKTICWYTKQFDDIQNNFLIYETICWYTKQFFDIQNNLLIYKTICWYTKQFDDMETNSIILTTTTILECNLCNIYWKYMHSSTLESATILKPLMWWLNDVIATWEKQSSVMCTYTIQTENSVIQGDTKTKRYINKMIPLSNNWRCVHRCVSTTSFEAVINHAETLSKTWWLWWWWWWWW